jgi:hypothetical protein
MASQQVLGVGAQTQAAAAAAGGMGFNSTLLTGTQGTTSPPTTQKTLLGQ